jgi:DNA-directed RNA polymerase subunit RPC12/RpoP
MKIIHKFEGKPETDEIGYLIECPRCRSLLLADTKDIRFYVVRSIDIRFDAHRYYCPACEKDIDHHVIGSTLIACYPKEIFNCK